MSFSSVKVTPEQHAEWLRVNAMLLPLMGVQRKVAPTTWGPPLWKRIHEWAFNFHGDQVRGQAEMEAFIAEVPCPVCVKHANEWIANHPPEWHDLGPWTWRWHQAVNVTRGKAGIDLKEATGQHRSNLRAELPATPAPE